MAVVLSWVPQVARTLRTRRTKDISLGLPLLLLAGSVLWVAYGLHLKDQIIVAVNAIVFSFNALILGVKLGCREK